MEKRQYSTIDIAKFIFSLLILMLHAQQKSNMYPDVHSLFGACYLFVFQIICRLAVPFFFITSSYFLFKGAAGGVETKQRVFKYIKRLLILYAVWFVVNIPYIIFEKLGFPDNMSIKLFIKLIRDIVLYNGFPSSWFLMASIIDAWIIWMLTKNGRNTPAIVVSIICYAICLLMTFYNFLVGESINEIFGYINKVWKAFYISFPYGLIYFTLGKILAEKEKKINIKTSKLVILFIFSFVLLFAELFGFMYLYPGFSTNSYTTYLTLPFVSTLLVMLCLRIHIPNKRIYVSMRKASTIIYCSHGSAIVFLYNIILRYKLSIYLNFLILFIVTSIICLLLSLLVIKFSNKYTKLKYLY